MRRALSAFQLATRLETDPGQAWMLAMTEDEPTARRLGGELAEELEAFGHRTVTIAPAGAAEVLSTVSGETTCLIFGDSLDEAAWSALDRARSRLEHESGERVVFAMSRRACDRAARHAPNLWSFLASAVYELADEEPISADEREQRLIELREAHGLSDAQVVERFERGAAPASPDVAEWLILLGRGELLRRGEP